MTMSAAVAHSTPVLFCPPRRSLAGWLRRLSIPAGLLVLAALSACNGSAVVTLTATPSTDNYLAYRVGLVSIQLQTSNARTAAAVLPKGTTVDLARLTNLSEVVGVAPLAAGNYSEALITLDYSSAQIIYDNGTVSGLALKPVNASGQALGQVTLLLYLDPSDQLGVVRKSSARLSLAFNLAASNVINVAEKTVTVMPLISASTQTLDSKVVRIRGSFGSINSSSTGFTTGDIVPFDFGNSGAGSLGVGVQSVTSFEINGTPATGTAGITKMASLKAGAMVEAFGTLTTSTSTSSSLTSGSTASTTTEVTTCSDGTTPVTGTNGVQTCADGSTPTTTAENTSDTGSLTGTIVNFSASQVLAGSSVQGDGLDRLSGIVTGRSGDTLTIDEGTLLTNEGTNSLIAGTATVKIGPNTQVTQFGGASTEANGIADISVGSLVYAFGTASAISSASVTLDASAGRVRLGQTTVSGLSHCPRHGYPDSQSDESGRDPGRPFRGLVRLHRHRCYRRGCQRNGLSGDDRRSDPDQCNDRRAGPGNRHRHAVRSREFVHGRPGRDGAARLHDHQCRAGDGLHRRHAGPLRVLQHDGNRPRRAQQRRRRAAQIQIGAQVVPIVGIPSDPIIVPNASSSNTVFTIGHAVSGTFENFDTYSAFITQLQLELNGEVLATGVTAQGQYTANTYTFSASSLTLFLNN